MDHPIAFADNRKFDLVCLGRLGIDLNCNQYNRPMCEVDSFSPTVGGSPANIAIGAAKLGASVGFVGRVSNDQLGSFILKKLPSWPTSARRFFTRPAYSRLNMPIYLYAC